MPFDPDSYLQEKTQSFNPDAYLSEKQADNKGSLGDRAVHALEGFGNAALSLSPLGGLPSWQARLTAGEPDPDAAINSKLRSQGATIIEPDWNDYESQKQGYEKLRQDTAENDPEAFYGGELALALPAAAAGLVGGAKSIAPAMGGLLKKNAMQGLLKYGGPAAAAYNIYKSVTKKE